MPPSPQSVTPFPDQLDAAIRDAIQVLEARLQCSTKDAKTHRVLIIEGWQTDKATIDAVATYLVGLLASAIGRALTVRSQLEDSRADRLELVRNVEAIAGSPAAPLTTDQKQDERNPWIAEGMWHLCLFLSSRRADLHPLGPVISLDMPHIAAKDHGFDVIGLFQDSVGIGLTLVESKAYEKNPNKAINNAVDFFKSFDDGNHDARARQTVASMREALPANVQSEVSPSLWKGRRIYLPNPHYDECEPMDWTNTRSSFRDLAVPADAIFIMPHCVRQFAQFFDQVADAMKTVAEKFKDV